MTKIFKIRNCDYVVDNTVIKNIVLEYLLYFTEIHDECPFLIGLC